MLLTDGPAVMCVTAPAPEREDRTLLPNGQMNAIVSEASDERAMHASRGPVTGGPPLSRRRNAEFAIPLGRKSSPLETGDFLSGAFEPVPLGDVVALLRAREAAETIRLVARK